MKPTALRRLPRPAAALARFSALALGLAGCASGPDFHRPAMPEVAVHTAIETPMTTVAAPTAHGEAQRLVPGLDVERAWWRTLKSPKLDALIEAAFAENRSLAAARATLRQAQAVHAAQTGSTELPRVDANLGAQRQRTNPSTFGQPGDPREFSLYNASVGVRYNLDLSGGNRRALEALAARADFRGHELQAARLTLAANLAATAITQARLAAQVVATENIVKDQDAQVRIAEDRVRLGQAADSEVLALRTQAAQTRAELPALRKQLAQTRHLLATLAGRAPGGVSLASGVEAVPDFSLDDFALPAELPGAVPSEWVRRRPDILASEALMRAANADYGVAVARRYPQVTLSANLGSQALTTGALFGGPAAIWSLLGQLTQPLFNAGLPEERRAALAAFDAAAANYQAVVLEALRSVADALRAVDEDAQVLAARAVADASAQESLRIVERQYRLGAASHLQQLVARQQAEQTRLGLIAARAQRLADSVALYQSMGVGGEGQAAIE